MKFNIFLLFFALFLSISMFVVKTSLRNKRSPFNHYEYEITDPINYCPRKIDIFNQKVKIVDNENLSGKNINAFKKLRNAFRKGYFVARMFKKRLPGIQEKIYEKLKTRDLNELASVYAKGDNINNEFLNINTDKGLPDKYDWTNESSVCFKGISSQNQGFCGSCYIFSTVNYFSILNCFENGSQLLFSIQDVLSCMRRSDGLNNCQGGSPKDVWEHLYANGVVTHSCKCYRNHDYIDEEDKSFKKEDFLYYYGNRNPSEIEKCQNKCNDSTHIHTRFKPKTNDILMVSSPKTTASLIYNYGILIGSLNLNSKLIKNYDENDEVLNSLNHGKTLSQLFSSDEENSHHSVIIVGYKVRNDLKDCTEFLTEGGMLKYNCLNFKILNSWGNEFGKDGYAYIPDILLDNSYLAFAVTAQKERFIKESINKKDLYIFKKGGKEIKLG